MKWPWVSRTAYDVVCSERDHLRAEYAKAVDHNRRIERKEAGMTELPREPKGPSPRMPGEVMDYLKAITPLSLRRVTEDDFWTSYNESESWDAVLEVVRQA